MVQDSLSQSQPATNGGIPRGRPQRGFPTRNEVVRFVDEQPHRVVVPLVDVQPAGGRRVYTRWSLVMYEGIKYMKYNI